jgi:hypothetical protein
MATAERAPATSFITIPRAVLSVAAEIVFNVERAMVGDSNVRTARSNAWDAICADQARNKHRDDTRRVVAALARTAPARSLKAQLTVGSSPRSSASQATLVSTGRPTAELVSAGTSARD